MTNDECLAYAHEVLAAADRAAGRLIIFLFHDVTTQEALKETFVESMQELYESRQAALPANAPRAVREAVPQAYCLADDERLTTVVLAADKEIYRLASAVLGGRDRKPYFDVPVQRLLH